MPARLTTLGGLIALLVFLVTVVLLVVGQIDRTTGALIAALALAVIL